MADKDELNNDKPSEIEVHGHYHKLSKKVKSVLQCLDDYGNSQSFAAYDDSTGRECEWNTATAPLHQVQHNLLEQRLGKLLKVKHANIFQFYDYWIKPNEDGTLDIHLISESIDRRSAQRYMKQNPVQMKVWKRWCRQILSALSCLSSYNVVHGDLTLERLYIQPDGIAKLGDLDLGDLRKRMAGKSVTLLAFSAPELFNKDAEITVAADIYSFGMMVLQFATTEAPYSECSTTEEITEKILGQVPPICLSQVPQDSSLRELITLCCQWNPADRPTPDVLLHHRFFFEVPSLKVYTAWYIIRNKIEDRYGNHRLRPQDKAFLNEVSSGVWGTLSNVTQRPPLEFRRVLTNGIFNIYKKPSFKRDNQTIIGFVLVYGFPDSQRRTVKFEYVVENDTPTSITDELINEGLLSLEDKDLMIAKIKDNLDSKVTSKKF